MPSWTPTRYRRLPSALHCTASDVLHRVWQTVPAQALAQVNTMPSGTAREIVDVSAVAQLHGRDWGHLAAAVPSKTLTQIKNYYQNYKVKVWVRH